MSDNIEKRVSDAELKEIEIDEGRNYTPGQVAKICNVSPKTVLKWFDSGELRGFRVPGSKYRRIPGRYLAEFIKESGMNVGESGVYTTGQVVKILGQAISQQTVIRQFDAGDFEGGYCIPCSKFRRIPHSSLIKFAEKYGMMPQLENYFGRPAVK